MKKMWPGRIWTTIGVSIIILFVVSLAASAHYVNHLSTGVSSTGSEGTTRSSSGGLSEAAANLSTPSAFTETGEDSIFGGFSLVTNQTAPGGEGADGAVFMGAGFGKPGLSVELTLSASDVSEIDDYILSYRFNFIKESSSFPALAFGIEGLKEIPGQLEYSPYFVVSKTFPESQVPFIASLGWGMGRFGENLFGAVAVVINRQCNLIVEYDGLGGNTGVSYAFKGEPPVVLTLGLQDVFASEQESTLALAGGICFH